MKVVVNRDSVAAGDDVKSHRVSFEVDDTLQLTNLFEHIALANYLPSVSGRGHSWHVSANNRHIARFVANRRQPESSKLLAVPIADFAIEGEILIHFHYFSATY